MWPQGGKHFMSYPSHSGGTVQNAFLVYSTITGTLCNLSVKKAPFDLCESIIILSFDKRIQNVSEIGSEAFNNDVSALLEMEASEERFDAFVLSCGHLELLMANMANVSSSNSFTLLAVASCRPVYVSMANGLDFFGSDSTAGFLRVLVSDGKFLAMPSFVWSVVPFVTLSVLALPSSILAGMLLVDELLLATRCGTAVAICMAL